MLEFGCGGLVCLFGFACLVLFVYLGCFGFYYCYLYWFSSVGFLTLLFI